MIPALQKITVLILALLQFAAPLVHAHSGVQSDGLGVHIPGLESWSVGTNEDSLSSGNSQFPLKSCLVAVSTAIQQKQPVSTVPSSHCAIIPPVETYTVCSDGCLINFSPHLIQVTSLPPHHWHGSRAPPLIG